MSDILTVIPVYNGEPYLKATLESLAAQTRRPDRVLVIDDCSTDGTVELVSDFKPFPCEIIQNEENIGLFPNLNHALEYAEDADYFHLLLADDCIRPDFLETMLQSLEGSSAPSLAYSQIDWIDTDGNVTQTGGKSGGRRGLPVTRERFIKRQSMLKTVSVGSVLIHSGGKPLPVAFRGDMPHVADCVFYAELASECHQIMEIGEALCEIRRHAGNATQRNMKNLNAWVADEFKAMQRISRLIYYRGWKSRVHDHRLQCLFAARSRVKQQWTRHHDPHFAEQIGVIVSRETSWFHRLLAAFAVILRDIALGKNQPERPR